MSPGILGLPEFCHQFWNSRWAALAPSLTRLSAPWQGAIDLTISFVISDLIWVTLRLRMKIQNFYWNESHVKKLKTHRELENFDKLEEPVPKLHPEANFSVWNASWFSQKNAKSHCEFSLRFCIFWTSFQTSAIEKLVSELIQEMEILGLVYHTKRLSCPKSENLWAMEISTL